LKVAILSAICDDQTTIFEDYNFFRNLMTFVHGFRLLKNTLINSAFAAIRGRFIAPNTTYCCWNAMIDIFSAMAAVASKVSMVGFFLGTVNILFMVFDDSYFVRNLISVDQNSDCWFFYRNLE